MDRCLSSFSGSVSAHTAGFPLAAGHSESSTCAPHRKSLPPRHGTYTACGLQWQGTIVCFYNVWVDTKTLNRRQILKEATLHLLCRKTFNISYIIICWRQKHPRIITCLGEQYTSQIAFKQINKSRYWPPWEKTYKALSLKNVPRAIPSKTRSSTHARESGKYIAAFDENSDTALSSEVHIMCARFNTGHLKPSSCPSLPALRATSHTGERHTSAWRARGCLPRGSCRLHPAENWLSSHRPPSSLLSSAEFLEALILLRALLKGNNVWGQKKKICKPKNEHIVLKIPILAKGGRKSSL